MHNKYNHPQQQSTRFLQRQQGSIATYSKKHNKNNINDRKYYEDRNSQQQGQIATFVRVCSRNNIQDGLDDDCEYEVQGYQEGRYQYNEQYDEQQECNFTDDILQFTNNSQKIRHAYPSKKIRTLTNPIIKHNISNNKLKNLQYHRLMSSSKKLSTHINSHVHSSSSQLVRNGSTHNKQSNPYKLVIKRKQSNQSNSSSISIVRNKQKQHRNQTNYNNFNKQNKRLTINSQPKPTPQPQLQPQHQLPTHSTTTNTTNTTNQKKNMDINTILSQVMLQNNEHLHRVNQNVVNRLLSIIETNQEIAMNSMNMSMKNSRWSTNGRRSDIGVCQLSNTKYIGKGANNSGVLGNRNYMVGEEQCQDKYNSDTKTHNIQHHQPQTTQPHPQPQQQSQHHQQSPYPSTNSITINNIIPTSTKSQQQLPFIKNNPISDLTDIKNKQIQLSQLEKRRNRRSREFNYRTPRLSDVDDGCNRKYQRSCQEDIGNSTPAQTPRNYNDNSSINQISYCSDNQSYNNSNTRNPRSNMYKKSVQCDQILQTPFQSQRDEITQQLTKQQPNQHPQIQPHMQKTNKIKQVSISSSILVVPDRNELISPVNQLESNIIPIINTQQHSVVVNEDGIRTQGSVQLPITAVRHGNINKNGNQNNNSSVNIKTGSMQSQIGESNMVYKQPVFMQIPTNQQNSNGQLSKMSLAEAFKRRIGKLPTKAERKAKQKQLQISNQQNSLKQKQLPEPNHNIAKSNTKSDAPISKHKSRRPNASLQVDVRSLNRKNQQNIPVTPLNEPSQQLLNRLIKGSKAEISKKEMYALTRKNYENLPQVKEKKKNEEKKMLELQRMERIKQYQKSIRASKTTIASNN